ncbi:DNA/RNA non-specific endonuclease, partial [Roseateles sp. GG27B]
MVLFTAPSYANKDFADCLQLFAGATPPVVTQRPTNRALCYDAFAILHSGESKTAVFVAEKLNKASVADADEKRTNRFFADARLRSAERATLEDYKRSGFDRGHMAPAGDMPTAQAMAQSFS